MRRVISIVLAVLMITSLTAVSFSAAGADKATVTIVGMKGETVTKTYAVGETFTAYSYLNVSEAVEGTTFGVSSVNARQTYTSDILEVADSYNNDAEDIDFGMVDDVEAMLPILGTSNSIANAGHSGTIFFNGSKAAKTGFKFLEDTSELIIVHYTVKAAGEATIENSFKTLAISDNTLSRLVDKDAIVNDKFTTPVDLSNPAAPAGFTVSGSFTSYLDAEGTVTFELVQNDDVVYSATAVGNTGSYAIEDVAAGEYTLRVSKLNHVTRDEYTVKVTDADVTQDVKICPLGDISGDGKVTTKDYAMANAHAQKITYQTGYALKCGDVLKGDGKITTADAARINAHAQRINLLW